MVQPPELTGGGGFSFEDAVVAIYLGALLGEESAPGLAGRIVSRVAVQQAAFGDPLDDLIVDGKASDGTESRLSLQIKRQLTISAAATNTDFREIVTRAWDTLNTPGFREDVNRVGFTTGTISDASQRALSEVCEWARVSQSAEGFFARFETPGFAGEQRQDVVRAFQIILSAHPAGKVCDAGVYRLLRHFVLVKFDLLHEGATDEANAIVRLRGHLHASVSNRASDLWNRLRVIAREGAGRSADFNRMSLLLVLHGAFRLAGAHSLQHDLNAISEEAAHSLATISSQIDGVEISRPSLVAKAKAAIQSHRFTNIVGLPGTGKSAVLRAFAEDERRKGPILFLKSDRLVGSSWANYATSIGLSTPSIEALLSEIAVTGSPVLFIDGIDRVEVPNRAIVFDVINKILISPLLRNWKILATSRDNGIEPLRTWLPAEIFAGAGIATVEVSAFDDDEARQLAEARPALKPLLFGDEQVREIARRPFFASVLAQSLPSGASISAPRSEIELINGWWIKGGYDSDAGRAIHRQRTLIQLAKSSARTLGRHIRLDNIDLDALQELKTDGVIKDVSAGHFVQFAHDIFFEWSFLHLLIDRDNAWLEEIQAVGEPPILGRTVELLSQTKFSKNEEWEENLSRLEAAQMRPQWLRAWLVAPFGVPTFWDRAQTLTDAVFRGDAPRLFKLAVWFQAEKTKANPVVLEGKIALENLSPPSILRLADALAWPSDFNAWVRFCSWVLVNIERCPIGAIPDLVSAFEVWQNAFSDAPNAVSTRIIDSVGKWLEDIDDREHSEELRFDRGPWSTLARTDFKELEERLRNLLLRSARVEQARVHDYLVRVQKRRHLRKHSFNQIITFTRILASHHAQDVAKLTLAELKSDLPAEIAARPATRGDWPHSFSYHDWENLAIHHFGFDFFPASPLREPFASLFQSAPDQGLLLVRELTNHAITAWRQLFKLDRQNRGTPLPLVLDFPWGQQEFFGDGRVYMCSRGHWGPAPVLCGLMALENWAFSEIDRGRDVDEVIRDVVAGHTSCAVLNIAAALALGNNRVSEATLPIAASQKLWEWDIARLVQDYPSQANLVGVMKPADIKHASAVRAGNERPARRMDIRSLASLFVLSSDEKLRAAAQKAITAFPLELIFTFKEEQEDEAHVASLRRKAEIWSEIGKIENYSATQAEDGKGVYIKLESPTASDSDVVATSKRLARMTDQLALLNWISDSFEKKTLSDKLALPDAVERAKKLCRTDLFVEPHGDMHDDDMDRNAASGTAAIAVLYGGSLADAEMDWVSDVLLRAAATPESHGEVWYSGSAIMYHPCLYSARGLCSLVRRGVNASAAKEALLRLAGHPLEAVSESAFAAALSLWNLDANFALIALNLGIRTSISSTNATLPAHFFHDPTAAAKRVEPMVDDAIRELKSGQIRMSLSALPAPWVFLPPKPSGFPLSDKLRGGRSIWRDPNEFLRWDFLPKILPHIPVAAAMKDALRRPAFLAFCYDLLKWILERVNPSWKEEEEVRRDRRSSEALILRARFFWLLGQVALYLEPSEAQHHILEPMFALDDEAAASMIKPFADFLAAGGIIDPPTVSPQALPLLEACVRRILQDRAWERARRCDGDIYGRDLPELVRIFLFVTIESAGGAARFANHDWRDITLVLPIIDKFVCSVGDVPHVASSFLTLCERAVDHYPAAKFVEQITTVLGMHRGTPTGWRHTTIPSRIASLIHAFAERSQPLPAALAQAMLRVLDTLVDMGDRRSAALQTSEIFKNVRL